MNGYVYPRLHPYKATCDVEKKKWKRKYVRYSIFSNRTVSSGELVIVLYSTVTSYVYIYDDVTNIRRAADLSNRLCYKYYGWLCYGFVSGALGCPRYNVRVYVRGTPPWKTCMTNEGWLVTRRAWAWEVLVSDGGEHMVASRSVQ